MATQVDLAKFVRREGPSLTLGGRPYFFAGFNNYYMMTRAADKNGSTRKEVNPAASRTEDGSRAHIQSCIPINGLVSIANGEFSLIAYVPSYAQGTLSMLILLDNNREL